MAAETAFLSSHGRHLQAAGFCRTPHRAAAAALFAQKVSASGVLPGLAGSLSRPLLAWNDVGQRKHCLHSTGGLQPQEPAK
jgi:hypothetical protein